MKPFYILIAGASLFSVLSAHADPNPINEAAPIPFVFDENPISASVIDEELSLLDEEMDEFEDEILALEEELKRDAESFNDTDKNEAVAVQAIAEQQDLTDQMDEEPVATAAPIEAISEKPIADAKEEAAPTDTIQQIEVNHDFALVMPVQQETPPLSTNELPKIDASTMSLTADASNRVLPSPDKEIAKLEESAEMAEDLVVVEVPEIQEAPAVLNVGANNAEKKNEAIEVNIQQAFSGSPVIYTILFAMSVFALCVWLYSILSLRKSASISAAFLKNVKNKLNSNQFDDALSLCQHHENLISKMVASGINARRHGLPVMIEAMKSEGKRASVHFWQRIGLLNDIAIIAPMLGLLGTVLGMFYAFYDINRSIESISTLFDGLGVSVGTTVAGLIVAILALMLHSFAKYRLVKVLATVENEAQSLATLIDDRTVEYKG
ncbi:MAG: MotA/TolQ/ExbB proton channel family protein [Parachlamydiales bacterium]|nr:MotA/TolQ/ExbB proton channel family protein [Candidatus Acheromyda pituitae]